MKVIAEIDVYKINDQETDLSRPTICLVSHQRLHSSRVVIVVEGTRLEIDADDLLKAVKRVKGV